VTSLRFKYGLAGEQVQGGKPGVSPFFCIFSAQEAAKEMGVGPALRNLSAIGALSFQPGTSSQDWDVTARLALKTPFKIVRDSALSICGGYESRFQPRKLSGLPQAVMSVRRWR
jgi:hypothetical protein